MQAVSSYIPDRHSVIGPALRALENEQQGFTAESYFSHKGVFARFVWPDWPASFSAQIAGSVNRFHQEHPELRAVKEGSEDWTAVFRDWRTDPESVGVIAEAFSKHFGRDRVAWVESERDARGRVGGHCKINGVGEITLHLSWRDSTAVPLGVLDESDRELFQQSANEVFRWAEQRIKPVLATLHDRLSELYGDRFRGLYVFGSYARPDAGIELPEDSDLDVALLLSNFESPHKEIERFASITSELSSKHGLLISVVPIRESDYRAGKTNFIRVISEEAIPVP
jgi:predicted nucleotidyltransferase